MAWDYAELSKAAKAAGGPEKLVNMIEEGAKAVGRVEGQSSMVTWIWLAALGASALTAGVIKLVDHFKAKKAISQAAVDEAKAELIQGIKDYDLAHPEENEDATPKEGEESND